MREGGHPLTFLCPPAPRWMRAVSFGTLWLPTIPPCCSNVNAKRWAPTYVSLPPCPKVDRTHPSSLSPHPSPWWVHPSLIPHPRPSHVNARGWTLNPRFYVRFSTHRKHRNTDPPHIESMFSMFWLGGCMYIEAWRSTHRKHRNLCFYVLVVGLGKGLDPRF